MKRASNKSHCPVNFALEAFGDPWSLLIVRDIAFWGKHTFREFLRSQESIASNVLAARLEHLEQQGIVAKSAHPSDKRKVVYSLTNKGVGLVTVLLEMSGWSEQHDPETTARKDFVAAARADRNSVYAAAQAKIGRGEPLFSDL